MEGVGIVQGGVTHARMQGSEMIWAPKYYIIHLGTLEQMGVHEH